MASINRLGRGKTSIVIRSSNGRALKCAYPEYISEVEHERAVFHHLGPHHGIVRYFGDETVKGRISLECYPFDVRKYLETGEPIPLELWSLQLAETLAYIHSKGVIHCDLSPRNMLTSGENIVLCDFAGSLLDGKGPANTGAEVRFRDWRSHAETGLQNDLFAMGSVLFELSTRKVPYVGLEDQEVIRLYQAMNFPPADDLLLGKVITKCWMGSYRSADHLRSDIVMTFKRSRATKPRWPIWLHLTLLCTLTSVLAYLFRSYVSN